MSARTLKQTKSKGKPLNISLLSMLLPGAAALLLFNYLPMAGIIIAFKDINYTKGILKSPWIGFKNFEFFHENPRRLDDHPECDPL